MGRSGELVDRAGALLARREHGIEVGAAGDERGQGRPQR
jgi:hypothetical protein